MQNIKCSGDHEIYVAEVVMVESEGKIVVCTVCRHCDTVNFHEKVVAKSPASLVSTKKENIK